MKNPCVTVGRCAFAALMLAQFLCLPSASGCLLCQAYGDPYGLNDSVVPVPAPTTTNAAPITSPAPVTNAPPEFISVGGTKYLSVSFAQLASFLPASVFAPTAGDSDSTASSRGLEQVPDRIKSLNEKSLALTGFILPVHTEGGLTSDFLLLRNQSACCYGVMPKINEWVVVRSAGKGLKAIMDVPVTVAGTFHVREQRENGVLTAIYQLDCDQLITPKN